MNIKRLFSAFAAMAICLCAAAQEQLTPEQERKEMMENIDKSVERMADALELSDAQVFYLDSILVHDYNAMHEELLALNAAKVSNSDIYVQARDKWSERMYQSIRKILNDAQWAKYLKSGAGSEKKARDKRAAKRK